MTYNKLEQRDQKNTPTQDRTPVQGRIGVPLDNKTDVTTGRDSRDVGKDDTSNTPKDDKPITFTKR